MANQQLLLPNDNLSGYTQDQIILLLAERLTVIQRDMTEMRSKLSTMASEQATQIAITDLSTVTKANHMQAETRLRVLED